MLGLEHDADAARLQRLLEPVGDLRRHALLHLQIARVHVDDARELREPDDARSRDVPDVRDAGERQQVMLAEGVERDVADDDELVVLAVVRERRRFERLDGLELLVHSRDAAGRVAQRLVVEVVAEAGQQIGGGLLDLGQIDRPAGADGVRRAHARSVAAV